VKPTYSDKDLMKLLDVDEATLSRFKQIQKETILQAKKLFAKPKGKLNIIGVSGSARDEFNYAQEKSNSETLLEEALNECKKLGAKTELIKLRNYSIKPCKACYSTTNTQCHYPCSCYPRGTIEGDDMSNILYDKVIVADAIIFATPVNNFKVSSFMSLFMDRLISLDGSLSPANPKNPKDKELNIKHTKFVELTANDSTNGYGFLRRFAGKVGVMIATGHEEGASMPISSLYMTMSQWGMLFPAFSNMYAMSTVANPTYSDKEFVTSTFYKKEAELLAKNVVALTKLVKDKKEIWSVDKTKN
jgi:multimeric flavodoxin WrbA